MRKIKDADNHLRTGFLGTPLLAPVLDKYGQSDLVYTILFKESYPSWFYSINQGATTMWERWNSYSHENGFGDAGMNSFNHYAYGAIGQWLYEQVAGISPLEPGYKKVLIAPLIGGPLTSAQASYESKYGTFASSWKKEGNSITLQVTVAPNTTAEIHMPIEKGMTLLVNDKEIAKNPDVKFIAEDENSIKLEVGSGTYYLKAMK